MCEVLNYTVATVVVLAVDLRGFSMCSEYSVKLYTDIQYNDPPRRGNNLIHFSIMMTQVFEPLKLLHPPSLFSPFCLHIDPFSFILNTLPLCFTCVLIETTFCTPCSECCSLVLLLTQGVKAQSRVGLGQIITE